MKVFLLLFISFDNYNYISKISCFLSLELNLYHSVADVAQLVEPWFVVPVVVGSSPIVRPIFRIKNNHSKQRYGAKKLV